MATSQFAPAEEFAELWTLLHSLPLESELSADDRWRVEYRAEQRRRIIAGVQLDLLGGPAVTRYRRNAPEVPFERPAIEAIEAKMERIADDPLATFGAARADRPAFLSREEKDHIIRAASNWLRLKQRVRIANGPSAIDPSFGNYRFIGREGVIFRLCSGVFADHAYVFLDPVGSERTEKIIMVEIRDLAPLHSGCENQ